VIPEQQVPPDPPQPPVEASPLLDFSPLFFFSSCCPPPHECRTHSCLRLVCSGVVSSGCTRQKHEVDVSCDFPFGLCLSPYLETSVSFVVFQLSLHLPFDHQVPLLRYPFPPDVRLLLTTPPLSLHLLRRHVVLD